MHKWLALLLVCIAVPVMAQDTHNTVPSALTSTFNTDNQTFLTDEDADRFADSLTPFVVSGCLGSTSASKVMAAFACQAYTETGFYVNQPSAAIDFGAAPVSCADTDTGWVVVTKTTTSTLSGNFQRVTGTRYAVDCTSTTQPAAPTDSTNIMQVVIAAGAIDTVIDRRALGTLMPAQPNSHGETRVDNELRKWFADQGRAYVASGCTPAVPSSSLTLDAFACAGYIESSSTWTYVTQDAATVGPLNGGNGTYWLALHTSPSDAVAGWTREANTHYLWQLNAAQPAAPSDGLLVARITVAAGVISATTALAPSNPWPSGVAYLSDPRWGCAGDGTTDDTSCLQAVFNNNTIGEVVCEAGKTYRITSTVTLPQGIAFVAAAAAAPQADPTGDSNRSAACIIDHDFNGTGFQLDGSAFDNAGQGYLLRNIIFESSTGDGTGSAGTAILITGTTTVRRPNWVRLENLQIERRTTSFDSFAIGIDINGLSVGGTDGVRDIWIVNSRAAINAPGTDCIRMQNAFNVFVLGTMCNLAEGDITITGTAGNITSSVFINHSSASDVLVDFASTVTINGGAFESIADNATNTTGPFLVLGSRVTNTPALVGSESVFMGYDLITNTMMTQIDASNAHVFGRDAGAGDSTDLTQIGIGNTGASEGLGLLRYTNAAATGGPTFSVLFTPRNNADSGAFDGKGIVMSKTGGADTTTMKVESTGGHVEIGPTGQFLVNDGEGNAFIVKDSGAVTILEQATPPAGPVNGDIYVDTSGALCFYDGVAAGWVVAAGAGTCS